MVDGAGFGTGSAGPSSARLAYMDWSLCSAVERDPERMGGEWCFRGIRLKVADLFDHLDKGATIDEFLEWFPGLPPERVHEVLEFAKASLEQPTTVA